MHGVKNSMNNNQSGTTLPSYPYFLKYTKRIFYLVCANPSKAHVQLDEMESYQFVGMAHMHSYCCVTIK